MSAAESDDVLAAHHGLAAGKQELVAAQLVCLLDDALKLVQRKAQSVAVFRGPAAGALEVAGAGRVDEDGPGYVAAVFARLRFCMGVPISEPLTTMVSYSLRR
jgi:hypothetical protein